MKFTVEDVLRQCRVAAADHVLTAVSDLTLEGQFGETWLVVSRDRLQIFQARNGTGELRHDLLLKDIRGARLVPSVGCGALEATVHGQPVELIRYSHGKQKRFSGIARYLTEYSQYVAAGGNGASDPPTPPEIEEAGKAAGTSASPAAVAWRLGRYLKPYRKQALLMTVLILGNTAVGLVTPYLTRPLVDVVLTPVENPLVRHDRLTYLFLIVGGMLACQLVSLGLNIVQGRTASRLTHRLANTLRLDVFQHLQFLSVRYFDKKEVGALVSRITQDTAEIESALTMSAQFLLANVLSIVGIGVILGFLNWKLFLLVIVPLPAVYLFTRVIFNRMFTMWNRWWHFRGRLHAVLTESLFGVRIVKAFAQEHAEIKRFQQRSDDVALAGQEADRTWVTVFPILSLLTGLGALLVWFVGGRQVLDEAITLGTLMTFIAYLGMFYGPFQFVTRATEWAGRALAAAERIFDILDSLPDTPESQASIPCPKLRGAVAFRQVWFGYDPHVPVLKDIQLEIAPGEMTGLVGHSGAGKSTMMNLLCRFYDVDAGQILIDGIDIRRIPQRDLRSQLGVVSQDTFLFNTSIAENIRYARPEASYVDVVAAAKAANAHEFIVQKPDGYDTIVGEGGHSLSGGERQRLAIARALLHDPRILVLDEATSAVDADTERQIQDALTRLIKGRTTFAIAHRLSTLRNADRLIVLKDGRIVESGTHDELLERDGEFARLVRIQQDVSRINWVER